MASKCRTVNGNYQLNSSWQIPVDYFIIFTAEEVVAGAC